MLTPHLIAGVQEYKKKLKQTLAEHHNTISEMKMDGVTSTSQIQDQHTETELSLLKEKQDLQADLRELNLCRDAYMKELQLVSLVFFLHFCFCFISTSELL